MSTILIGIAGGTGSGKTTLTRHLKEHFGPEVTVIGHDNYYKRQDGKTLEERAKVNYDHPAAFDTELLIEHLKELKEGRPIRCPVYSYVEHNRTEETREILPTKVIIVEGILIFQNPLSGICLTLRSLWRRMPTSASSAVLCGMWRNGPDAPICCHPIPHHGKTHARAVCGAKPQICRHHRLGGWPQSGGSGDDHAAHPRPHRHPLNFLKSKRRWLFPSPLRHISALLYILESFYLSFTVFPRLAPTTPKPDSLPAHGFRVPAAVPPLRRPRR